MKVHYHVFSVRSRMGKLLHLRLFVSWAIMVFDENRTKFYDITRQLDANDIISNMLLESTRQDVYEQLVDEKKQRDYGFDFGPAI